MTWSDIRFQDVPAFLNAYAPDWASKKVRPVTSSGTDNRLFMLGDDCVLRLPGRPSAVAPLRKELTWLPKLTGLPLCIPNVLFHGRTETGIDFGILNWLEGSVATSDRVDEPVQAAKSLAAFLAALRKIPVFGAPIAGRQNHHRGTQLAELTAKTLAAIDVLSDEIRADDAREMWELGCSEPFSGPSVWVHGDLKADNMLAQGGQLTGVIDWGLSAVGDPAVDLAAAWTWVVPDARKAFQSASAASTNTWRRAQSWALYSAVIALSYYRDRSHQTLCEQSRRTLHNLDLRRC